MLYDDRKVHRGFPVIGQERPSRRRVSVGPVLVYPLFGPAAMGLTMAVPLAILGLFTLGPGGLLYYVILAGWWLPGLYKLFAPPFLLTGIFIGLTGVFITRWSSIIVAMIAAELAFSAYFGIWLLIPGEVEAVAPDYAKLWPSLRGSPASVLPVLTATAGCWFLMRAIERGGSPAICEPSDPAYAARWRPRGGVAAMVIGAAGLAAVFAGTGRSPAIAWKECTEGSGEDRIRGCTIIVERVAEESAQRRATAHLRRGSAYDNFNQPSPRAIADFSAAISLAPQLAEAHARRGLAYARTGEYDAVIVDLDMVVRLDPNVLSSHYTHQIYRSRGLAHFHKGEIDRAIADHTEEIRLTPHYADGYLNRAAAFLAKGFIEQAIVDFTNAIRIEPFRPEGYIERGSIYLSRGDADRALADFDEAIRRRPDQRLTAPAYRKRGVVVESRGNLTDALAAFDKALALNPSDAEARQAGERIRSTLSRHQKG
jgi:tetratricopeptide (TPR) repeat protein